MKRTLFFVGMASMFCISCQSPRSEYGKQQALTKPLTKILREDLASDSAENVSFYKRSVSIQFDQDWARLDFLDAIARAYIKQRDKRFTETEGLVLVLHIAHNEVKNFVTLVYYGRMGTPYWSVSFDRNEKISDYATGMAED